jgi:hypothetical protein
VGIRKVFTVLWLSITLSSCATVKTSMIAGTQSPGVANGYRGVLYVELGGLTDARPVMLRECSPYGGLRETSVRAGGADGMIAALNSIGGTYWSYECHPPATKTSAPEPQFKNDQQVRSQTIDERAVSNSLEEAKSKCSNLGFKAGTEKHGDCVLRLSK